MNKKRIISIICTFNFATFGEIKCNPDLQVDKLFPANPVCIYTFND